MQDGIVELWMTSRGFERKGEAAADDIIKDNTAARVCTRVENLPRLHRHPGQLPPAHGRDHRRCCGKPVRPGQCGGGRSAADPGGETQRAGHRRPVPVAEGHRRPHRLECMGDLARCDKGYFLAMWLQFRGVGYQRGVYLSNGGHSADSHGVAFFYSKGKLEVVFKMADGREWRARASDVLEDRWYHVAATWSQDEGLHLYINGERVHRIKTPTRRQAVSESSRYNGFYVGRANDNTGTERLGRVMVDDLIFVSAFKTEAEVKESGPIYHYYLSMDEMQQDQVTGEGLSARVYGPVNRGSGKIEGALSFTGSRSYADLGDMSGTCIADLQMCEYGLYFSFWVTFGRLDNGPATLLSSPSVRVYQDGTQLVANARKSTEFWETRYQGLQPRAWYFVEVSWHPNDGISLYVNLQRYGYQPNPTYRPQETRPTAHMGGGTQLATLDELDVYYADRDTLLNIDFIERGEGSKGKGARVYLEEDSAPSDFSFSFGFLDHRTTYQHAFHHGQRDRRSSGAREHVRQHGGPPRLVPGKWARPCSSTAKTMSSTLGFKAVAASATLTYVPMA
ncbi:hypothetical protein C0Q70_00540 [Pomacea canaliculata]|uniref:Uncharacterized protein n=1 Tax=Pomacea canaliculata TaxID=400727 RepID=A0A2T7PX07_POMCA|nr:hypothetical protein C0Q70_00540 [Pomacea canaliculata]